MALDRLSLRKKRKMKIETKFNMLFNDLFLRAYYKANERIRAIRMKCLASRG